jgi:hypothetical protein
VQSTFEYYQPNIMARQLAIPSIIPHAQRRYQGIHASKKGF